MKDWFRRSTWSANDRADFETQLRRARPASRPQYLRIQAFHLWEAGQDNLVPPALELLERFLAEYPDDIQIAQAEHQRAQCYESLRDTVRATESYRAAIEAERRRPNVGTEATLDFALLVAEQKLVSLFEEVSALLREHPETRRPFPVQRFKYHAARALLASHAGEPAAKTEAARALTEAEATESGFRYHADLGLVGERHQFLRRRLEAIAA